MKLLLDTHALLWWLGDDPQLATEARKAIADSEHLVAVSAASAWEISIKRALGKLDAPDDLTDAVAASGFEPLPITLQHAVGVASLPRHHDDPFDRMLIAQAQAEDLTIVTRDPRFRDYRVGIVDA